MWLSFLTPLIAFCVASVAVGWLASGAASTLALDKPNARSLHDTPVPRTGGVGLLLGVVAGWTFAGPDLPGLLWTAVLLLIGVSLTDDLLEKGLSAGLRLAAQLVAASIAIIALQPTDFSWFGYMIAALAVCWMCNLYNFMDGSDGLAGGMTLFGFLAYASAAFFSGKTEFAVLNLVVAAAAAGFLLHNFHPARIFMGDAGSVPLGFLAAAFGLAGWLGGAWTWWFPVVVFSPFIVDASVTLGRRLIAGEPFWRAHRDHYYQRLVQLGWGHRRTAIAEYLLMFACSLASLLALGWPQTGQWVLLIAVIIAYLSLIGAIEIAWRRYQKNAAS